MTASTAVPDEVLVRQAALGDKQAFGELVSRYGPALYRFVRRLLHNTQDAEDCVQDVVIAAWRHLGTFRGDASFRTWLYVLARRQAVKQATSGRADVHTLDPEDDVRDTHPGPEGENIETGLLAALDEVLRGLPERQRSVWLLREVEGLSYSEIGTVVNLPVSTVRGLLERARTGVANGLEAWR